MKSRDKPKREKQRPKKLKGWKQEKHKRRGEQIRRLLAGVDRPPKP